MWPRVKSPCPAATSTLPATISFSLSARLCFVSRTDAFAIFVSSAYRASELPRSLTRNPKALQCEGGGRRSAETLGVGADELRRGSLGHGLCRLERGGNGFLDALKPDEFHLLARNLRNVVEITPIARGQHDPPDAGTM